MDDLLVQFGLRFPSEAEALYRQCEEFKDWSPEQRLGAVADLNRAVEALSLAGGVREEQLKYHEQQEEEWQRIMREFIKEHVSV